MTEMTIYNFAEILGVSYQSVKNWIKKAKLQPVRRVTNGPNHGLMYYSLDDLVDVAARYKKGKNQKARATAGPIPPPQGEMR